MKSKQRYLVITHGDSRMGASANYGFCCGDDLTEFGLYAEYIDVYPVGKELTKNEKRKLGMVFSEDK